MGGRLHFPRTCFEESNVFHTYSQKAALFFWNVLAWNVFKTGCTAHGQWFPKECAQCEKLHKMGVLAWAITNFGLVLDHASLWLTDQEAANAIDNGLLYIQLFMHLATEAWEQKRPRYRIRPKIHSFQCEILQRLCAGSRLNPRFISCSNEEDLIGKVMAIVKNKLHASTLARRVLERYMLGINVFLMGLKRSKWWSLVVWWGKKGQFRRQHFVSWNIPCNMKNLYIYIYSFYYEMRRICL